ncbi:MAG: beta-galactosidase trimerization domain-containing protein [Kiritimatiellae bacterium]|nr:beta-galactosidase trimerization domain-containing protein [Kiritimatiellia bacterium]
MKTARVRLEWGTLLPYNVTPAHQPRIDWSGSFKICNGKVLIRKFYKLKNYGFCPGHEITYPLEGNAWSSTGPREIAGIILEVAYSRKTILKIKMAGGEFSFPVIELEKSLFLDWPVGPACARQKIRAGLIGKDPMESGFPGDPLPEAVPPTPFLAIEPWEFTDARCFYSYWLRAPAWIEQFGEATASFTLESEKPLVLRLFMMLGPPYALDNVNAGKTSRYMEYEVLINGHSLGLQKRYFSFFRSNQKLEEITLKVPPEFLRRGRNSLTVRNHDHVFHLLLAKAEFHKRICDDNFTPAKLPNGYLCGFDTNVIAPENIDEFLARLAYIRDSGLGNFALLRFEGSNISRKAIDRILFLLRKKKLYFTYMFDETSATGHLQRIGGALFMGQHFHEKSHCDDAYGAIGRKKDPGPTMRSACEEYLGYVGRIVGRVKTRSPETKVLMGESQLFASYNYLAGVDHVLAQPNVWHNGLMLAEARGACRSFDRKIFCAHLAGGCFESPMGLDSERMYMLTLHSCYLHGVNWVYDEESALNMSHGKPYSFSSRFCRGRRALLNRYNHFVAEHGSPGEPLVDTAMVIGRFECPPFAYNHDPEESKVWPRFGGEAELWDCASPEKGWTLLDMFMPGMWTPGYAQDWRKIRFWHSGTPFGQFDIISSEAPIEAFQKYKLLIFPGWNSMCRGLYQKLCEYVRNGGHLMMSLPQLSKRDDREFLNDMKHPEFVEHGDFNELFGIRVKPGKYGLSKKITYAGREFLLDGGVLNPEISVNGAEITGYDDRKKPALVTRRNGKGSATLLTLLEYPGAAPLNGITKKIWRDGVLNIQGDVKVSDPSGEVAWYLFKKDGQRHLWLLNTHWFTPDNQKELMICVSGRQMKVRVKAGSPLRIFLDGK